MDLTKFVKLFVFRNNLTHSLIMSTNNFSTDNQANNNHIADNQSYNYYMLRKYIDPTESDEEELEWDRYLDDYYEDHRIRNRLHF
ncbi:hypothetical protein [Acanthamoeba castellanii mimivirus]|uniref:Uncharacterized protein n=3 Tax=Mimivirus TaxID=315393 RepID=E3VXQ3_MIMIV|nr:hypothetical protein MIMI_gp0040 [Acanthamoeba polyphaga mimivirus]AHA45854.1 hypothetical protein HIRU_S948 [Hirudovirus strain Sangsue]BAV61109.1 hypothetical protein [Acanthamoeba castellanii mimivirus]ADO18152.1 hypothetical protein [Acanthamoeba polyphaga mimivirus]AKI80679.1 hypothetical protein [Acanthamoeba polyphaga mimivirus]UTE95942.1 hypothetical protein MIMI-L34b [Acanthamoeba polyphaga mimivirus]